MKKASKFDGLARFFSELSLNEITLSFVEIENIIGTELTPSAYQYPALWSNSDSHPIAKTWLQNGYLSQNLDLTNQHITFVKALHTQNLKTKRQINYSPHRASTLSCEDCISYIQKYYDDTQKDKNGRYQSWKHCYAAFHKFRGTQNQEINDFLALHLAFYLASWGMYRGSSFLLQKDYKVHIPIVEILLEPQYDPLVGISAQDLRKSESLNLMESIGYRIKQAYANVDESIPGRINNATDTLVTKILLGTLGCIPAYDRFYVNAVKHYNVSSGIYNRTSILEIANFYCEHSDAFEKLRSQFSSHELEYPPMKLMDMCFWQAGFTDYEVPKDGEDPN